MDMTNTNQTERETVLANLQSARERMAAFIRKTTGANIDEATIIRGVLVIGGSWTEITLCVAVLAGPIGIEGITVDEYDRDDPEVTFARIPEGALEAALAKAQAA